jgi:hypothetical protein
VFGQQDRAVDRFCECCDALLELLAGDEMTSANRHYTCPECGTVYREDPGATLYELD